MLSKLNEFDCTGYVLRLKAGDARCCLRSSSSSFKYLYVGDAVISASTSGPLALNF